MRSSAQLVTDGILISSAASFTTSRTRFRAGLHRDGGSMAAEFLPAWRVGSVTSPLRPPHQPAEDRGRGVPDLGQTHDTVHFVRHQDVGAERRARRPARWVQRTHPPGLRAPFSSTSAWPRRDWRRRQPSHGGVPAHRGSPALPPVDRARRAALPEAPEPYPGPLREGAAPPPASRPYRAAACSSDLTPTMSAAW